MISNKLNLIFGAAIFASTVYFLWVKIKRKSVSHDKENSNDKNSKLNLPTPEKHNEKKDELKNQECVTKNFETEHAESEIISNTLEKDSVPNLTKSDGACDNSLPANLNNPNEYIYSEEKYNDSVILDNVISKNDVSEHQIFDSESVPKNNFQILEECINDTNNETQSIYNRIIKDTLNFEDNDELKNVKINCNSNIVIEGKVEKEINMINMESNEQTFIENATKELVQNVLDENIELNNCLNEIFIEKLCPINISNNSLSDSMGNVIITEIDNEPNFVIPNPYIKDEYNKQVIDDGDNSSSALFENKNGENLQISEIEISQNQIQQSMHTETCLPISGADMGIKTNQYVPDEVEITFLPEDICLTETERSAIDIPNPYILTDSNVDIDYQNVSQIPLEFTKSKESTKSDEEIDFSETTNVLDNEANSAVKTADSNLENESIQSNIEINALELVDEEKSSFMGKCETLNCISAVDRDNSEVIENCFIEFDKVSESNNELSLETIERDIICETEADVKELEIEHDSQIEIQALLLTENTRVPQLETMTNNSLIQYDSINNSNIDNHFENEINNNPPQVPQDADVSSDISQNSDYIDDSPLTNFMEYVEECLNGNVSKHGEIDSNSKIENWPNDEDSLNDIKRDFYEMNNLICSPHPSSESDHAHCVNNLTERVAILSAESILDNQCHVSSSDSEMTTTLNSPIFGDSNPELYVEKITYDGKELDVVYFDEALLEEGGVHPDIKIIRTIPVGLGGRIIGKKGKTKNELMKKYGAQLLIYNHPVENGKQVLEITCSPSVRSQLENWVNRTLDQITKNTLQTTVSNPEWLKPMIPLGKLVAAHIVDMPTIQHIKLRIFDPEIIKEFNKMQIEMNLDYSNVDNTALLPRPVAIGCVCVAMIRPDYFLRAQIVDIYEDIAWIYLFDLGKICQTYLYYLFKIREKYMRVPFQIIPARIPNAVIKNKNITPDIIFKRFLCNQSTLKPIMVRIFFPRMHTCCEPCVNVYIPVSTVSGNENNEEFIDLLELLVSTDLCSMVKISVNSKIQTEINTSHVKAFLNEKASLNLTIPMYFQPYNSKFYEDFIEFKSESENS